MSMDKEERIEIRDLRGKDKFLLDDEFFNGYVKFLGIHVLGVYCSLCRHADRKQRAWPSQRKIAEELNLSRAKVIECIKLLEYFHIIKKVRIGKKCTNRYYLLDKKAWIRDEKVMSKGLTSGDVNMNDIRCQPGLHQVSTGLTSNSKDTQRKETQRKDQNESEIFFQKYTPLDPLLKVLSEEEIQHALKDLCFDEIYIKKIIQHIGKIYITEWLEAIKYAHVESKTKYLASVFNQAVVGKFFAFPEKYIQVIEKKKRRKDDNLILEFRKLPQDEKDKYLKLAREKCNYLIKSDLILEILGAGLWEKELSESHQEQGNF